MVVSLRITAESRLAGGTRDSITFLSPVDAGRRRHASALWPSAPAILRIIPARWAMTPVVARFVEHDQTWTKLGMPETPEFSGNYFKDRFGSWYRRMQIASHLNLLRVVGAPTPHCSTIVRTGRFTRWTSHAEQSVDRR